MRNPCKEIKDAQHLSVAEGKAEEVRNKRGKIKKRPCYKWLCRSVKELELYPVGNMIRFTF